MKTFVCLLDPRNRGIPEDLLRSFEGLPRRHGLRIEWQLEHGSAILSAWEGTFGEALIAREGHSVAVGVARLDNRQEIVHDLGVAGQDLPDLTLALRAVKYWGVEGISRLLGDFAVVIWDGETRTVLGASDPFSIKKLYYTERHGLLVFAGRAEALALGDRYEPRYFAERVGGCELTGELTAYEAVTAVPGGTIVLHDRGALSVRRYWNPETIPVLPPMRTPEAVDTFRELLIGAVRSRMEKDEAVWAQLSGGLDSSSLVSIAQWLAQKGDTAHGLAGTVTFVDRQGTPADEREYSDLVVRHWGVRNETIIDPPLWHDATYGLPRYDQPRPNLIFYSREYRLCDIVGRNGGRVLLTGQGPDEYLRGTLFFFADWLAAGRVRPAVREMLRWAAIGRVSFWELAYRNAVTPLLSPRLRRWLGPEVTHLPPWLHRDAARRYDLHGQRYEFALYGGPAGQKYRTSMIKGITALQRTIGHQIIDQELDVRHPFLDRKLVEFAMGLPPQMTTQPYEGKWILREAMRGLLPEAVRTRVGKGSLGERHAWSLASQRRLLEPLVQRPILAELGVVDERQLLRAFDAAPQQPHRKGDPHTALDAVLALEAWLQIRVGRWPRAVPQVKQGTERSLALFN